MQIAVSCETTAYKSLLVLSWAARADPEPILARLVRGCIAMAFTASAPAEQMSNPATALLMPSRAASSATSHWSCNASKPCTVVQIATDAGRGGPYRP